ncbi:hypothetical protein CYMTET_27149, partial [Cymbomonas tetramitiformis]
WRTSACTDDGVVDSQSLALRLENQYYDVLVANILLPPLLALVERMAQATRPGGAICLSGVLVEQAPRVIAAYDAFFQDLVVDADPEDAARRIFNLHCLPLVEFKIHHTQIHFWDTEQLEDGLCLQLQQEDN